MAKPKELEFIIRYRVGVEDCNIGETLENLREYGAADVVSVRIPKGAAKPLVTKILEDA